jgi:hypothetical protein
LWKNSNTLRIIVAGPPKTGNVWIKCLLAEIYHLEILDKPPCTDVEFSSAVKEGWFKDGAIFHQHLGPTPLLLETTSGLNCSLVTIIRNPYDTFISLYYFVQNFPQQFANSSDPLHRISGKPIDHPDIYAFLRDVSGGFGIHILSAKKWKDSDRSIILRYEDLSADPVRVLGEVAAQIRSEDEPALRSAVETCSLQNMRKQFKQNCKHIRKGKVGDWRVDLDPEHLDAIRTHANWIEDLGYEAYEPEIADKTRG